MKRFLSFFITDIAWKLLSLALAVVLWFVGANVNDPTLSRTYNLPLQLHNIEILENQNLIIIDEYPLETHVRLGVRAPRSVLDNLSSMDVGIQLGYITPIIDFRAVNADYIQSNNGSVIIRLDIGANLDVEKDLELFSIHPRFVYVEIDTIERSILPVTIDIIGEVGPGLELRPIQLANHSVAVTASRSVLTRVDNVRVQVNIAGIHSVETVQNLPLVVLCDNGSDITDLVQLSVTETSATIPVLQVETVELRVQPYGEVAAGFALAGVSLDPASINVIGTPDRLEDLEYIAIQLYLDGIREDQEIDVNILELLPVGVFLSGGESPHVEMSIIIEPIDRRIFHIPRDNVRIRGIAAIYQILSEQQLIRIDISGPRSIINQLHYTDIGLELDLRNRQIGIHNVTLAVDLPSEVTLATAAPFLQVQIHEPAAETDDDDYDYYHIEDELQEPQYPAYSDEHYEDYEYGYYEHDEESDA